jgi:hypothetical protein
MVYFGPLFRFVYSVLSWTTLQCMTDLVPWGVIVDVWVSSVAKHCRDSQIWQFYTNKVTPAFRDEPEKGLTRPVAPLIGPAWNESGKRSSASSKGRQRYLMTQPVWELSLVTGRRDDGREYPIHTIHTIPRPQKGDWETNKLSNPHCSL